MKTDHAPDWDRHGGDHAAERVRRALAEAGATPFLVGYDVNGIQEYVTANSRPLAMRGASWLIKEFDRAQHGQGALFAGGGRGLFLVPAAQASALAESLAKRFAADTITGDLAVASVPFAPKDPGASLRWMKLRLQSAKDATAAPDDERPATETERCVRCRRYRAKHARTVGDETEQLCDRCETITQAGSRAIQTERDRDSQFGSLAELVDEHEGHIAAVSADGNNMGVLFESLDTLERITAVSVAVSSIFSAAHAASLAASGATRYVAPITGGDDIRVFFAPRHVEQYVKTLADQVKDLATRYAPTLGLTGAQQARFVAMGVGIGVVCASKTSSATSMLQRAHHLERRAKTKCLDGETRSAVDFRWVNTGGLYLDGSSGDHETRDRRPVRLDDATWTRFVQETRALQKLPSSQRAVLSERSTLGPEEFANLFRYQVARSELWQRWYGDLDLDWRVADVVIRHCPDASHVEFLRMLSGSP